jgi:hypothetical protein
LSQIVYVWTDAELVICKIGKVNDQKRLTLRFKEALGANPRIRFVGAWRTKVLPRQGDAAELACAKYSALRQIFSTGAREWFKISADEAEHHLRGLFGAPEWSEIPSRVLNGIPWDPFGNVPTPLPNRSPSAAGLSRLWVHRERRGSGLLKVSDNSWWKDNIRATWNNTFNPHEFELLVGFEWKHFEDRLDEWADLNASARQIKHEFAEQYGPSQLPQVARCGWVECDLETVKQHLKAAGLVEFPTAHGPRRGVHGQGEQVPVR